MNPTRLMMSLFIGLSLSSCAVAPEAVAGGVVTELRSFEVSDGVTFNTLAQALETTGLEKVIDEREGPYTLFAPSDEAFAALPEAELEALLADDRALTDLLTYHLLANNRFTEGALFKLAPNGLITVSGDDLSLAFSDEKNEAIAGSGAQGLDINGESLSLPDLISTQRFVVHGVAAVLTPNR